MAHLFFGKCKIQEKTLGIEKTIEKISFGDLPLTNDQPNCFGRTPELLRKSSKMKCRSLPGSVSMGENIAGCDVESKTCLYIFP